MKFRALALASELRKSQHLVTSKFFGKIQRISLFSTCPVP